MSAKAVVFAYHDIGCAGIETLLDSGYEIAAVFTHPDDPKENAFYGSVAQLCARKGIPVHAPEDANHPLWIERISQLNPDYLFSFYYRNLLSEPLLATASKGAFNLHGSLLPRYRGRAPANWVLVNGETETGVTLHRMVKRADAGAIIAQQRVAIERSDTALILHGKLRVSATDLLRDTLPALLQGKVSETPQDESQATVFGRRTPADGKLLWNKPAEQLFNLVRAVTQPYPGAFCAVGEHKLIVWSADVAKDNEGLAPGRVISVDPLRIACGEDSLVINAGQRNDNGLYLSGPQLANELGLVDGSVLRGAESGRGPRRTRVLILGVNGFIGNHLSERLLRDDRYEVYGLDIGSDAIERLRSHPNFHFVEGDISIHSEWIEYHIKKCDVILPLVAIATPIEYTRNPLRVFELDFEENLKLVRYCVKYNKRVIFPVDLRSLWHVPGRQLRRRQLQPGGRADQQATLDLFDLQAVARPGDLGLRPERPEFHSVPSFQLDGPTPGPAGLGAHRQFPSHHPVDPEPGGRHADSSVRRRRAKKRCFTDIADGVEALARIIDNENDACNGQIINIGNPDNEASIRQLGEELLRQFEAHPLRNNFPPFAGFRDIESKAFYGTGYQDVSHRKPSIANAKRLLDWIPTVQMSETIGNTLDFFLREAMLERAEQSTEESC